MSNIVYSICTYIDKNSQKKFIDTIIKDYKIFYEKLNEKVDFKIVTDIPDVVNEQFEDIYQYYTKNNIQHDHPKYFNYLKLKENGKDQFPKHKNALKAWNTKFYLIEEFFKSNYTTMTYFDCDLILHEPPEEKFVPFPEILSFQARTQNPHRIAKEHIRVTNKFLPNIEAKKYVNMEFFYINKNCCFNLKEIINLHEIYSLWEKDSLFLREETALTYLFYKHNLFNKLQRHPPEGFHVKYKPVENMIANTGKWNSKLKYIESKLK